MATRKTKGKSGKRWVATVTTDSTHPRKGLFTKDAETIANYKNPAFVLGGWTPVVP